ncbi:MAG: nucleotide sugar dehydrogenase [Sphingomonadales bacterium]
MNHNRHIAVIGLGYVGLPVAVAFARIGKPVVAFDINDARITELRAGHDSTGEVELEDLKLPSLQLTTDPKQLAKADFFIVTVPTPITETKRPNLGALLAASQTAGQALKPGDIVVYESTVYPGATEEDCIPALEHTSGLRFDEDFKVGYSPERINPGDKEHRFENIKKIVSGCDDQTLDVVASVYEEVITAGVHRAPNIKTAEAAKVIENTQRDLNIALMNELALICHRLGIDTKDVLEAAGTKWNFLPFSPGLVGGHCIGVDPYYLTHKAEKEGYIPQVILAGRRINDNLGRFVAMETVRRLLKQGANGPLSVTILGITFKENVPDFRNTRVVDIIEELNRFGVSVAIHDPLADIDEVAREYGVTLTQFDDLPPADGVILAVAHDAYLEQSWTLIERLLGKDTGFVVDVRSCLDRASKPENIALWRL